MYEHIKFVLMAHPLEQVTPHLRRGLTEGNDGIRCRCCWWATDISAWDLIDVIQPLTAHSDEDIRSAARIFVDFRDELNAALAHMPIEPRLQSTNLGSRVVGFGTAWICCAVSILIDAPNMLLKIFNTGSHALTMIPFCLIVLPLLAIEWIGFIGLPIAGCLALFASSKRLPQK